MSSNQRISRNKKNDSCFGLTSRKHRFIFRQILSGSALQKKLLIFVLFAAAGFSVTLSLIIYLANKLLQGMNTSADPCENFYEYVCGNWQYSHSTSDDANSWFMERSRLVTNEIKNMLKEKHSPLDLKPVSQMKEFYKMCMNTSSLNRKGLQPLYDVLDLLGLPRMLPYPGISHDFNLSKVLAMSQKLLNLDIFMQIATHFNSTLNMTFLAIIPVVPEVVYIRPKTSRVKVRTVSTDEFLVSQIKYMTAVMKELTPSVNTKDISRAAMQIVSLDTQLKLIIERNKKPVFTARYFSVKNLETYMFGGNQSQDSPFSWLDYISTLSSGSNVSLQMNDTVVVANHEYFRGLGIELMNYKRIDFQQYVWWKIIADLSVHTTDRIRSHKFIFYEHVYDGTLKYSRSSDCISLIKSSFPEAIGHVMAKRNFVSNSVIKIENMLSRIKYALKIMIKKAFWLDIFGSAATVEKVDHVKAFVGYPDIIFNSTWLTEEFGNVDIIPNDFMSSLMSVYSVATAKTMRFIKGPYGYILENYSFLIDYSEVNAFYQRETNSIHILSGMLQYPFLIDGVESLNYGAMGTIIGHELMHGFDKEGIRYHCKGYELMGKTLWNDSITVAYNKQAECFINQYDQYYLMDNKTIDGNRTLSENIADNEGLRLAFRAYENYVLDNGPEPALPAFENFSHQQLLFMSFANTYCYKDSEAYKKLMQEDVHSTHRSRIIGTLSNMPEFAKYWNCQPDAPMNPNNKCSLW